MLQRATGWYSGSDNCFKDTYVFEEARSCHAELHSISGVTVEARDRMGDEFARVLKCHLVQVLKTLDAITTPGLLIRHVD
jgi:hypothetical protein